LNFLTTPGKRLFITGDEAVARAALEAGVNVVTGYPGNPSTKTITALLPLASTYGMTVEWSVNEKVALEVATGAAWAGKRSLVTMKMSGINVMADSLLSIAHSGVRGALVIYAVDDDPECLPALCGDGRAGLSALYNRCGQRYYRVKGRQA
jgi:indolepyruvate ferredoxin oxidoreductase, alpha subunit